MMTRARRLARPSPGAAFLWLCGTCSVCLDPSPALARTALTPAPTREAATLALSESGRHLVTETRQVGLLKGTNTVSFSWRNVAIDPGSLMLVPVDDTAGVRLIGLTFPPGESGAVLAEVYAERDAVCAFRVSYLLGNISREVGYQGTLSQGGANWEVRREVTVFNRSGERFDDVMVDLGSGLTHKGPLRYPEGRKIVESPHSPMAVERVYRVTLVPMAQVGGAPRPLTAELRYALTNDVKINPARTVLSPGKLRIFQEDKGGAHAFLGEDLLPAVAPGRRQEVSGGGAQDIRVKWFVELDEERNTQKARRSAQEPDTFTTRADRALRYRIEVKNHKDEPAAVYVTIPPAHRTGIKVLKSTHPTSVEHHLWDGILVKMQVPGGGKETVANVELLYVDYVFNTH